MKSNQIVPIMQALTAAVLFGASAPFSKLLLGEIQPVTLAGFLYLGSGLGAVMLRVFRSRVLRSFGQAENNEASLNRASLPWLCGAILAGGVIGPILLLEGLSQTPAATAALLLNFESVATALIATLVFKEAIGKRIWWAMTLITAASAVLSWEANGLWGFSFGALAVLGACLMWGIDNNLTCHISTKDPLEIVMVKGLAAGSFSLGLSFLLGYSLPGLETILRAMLLGCLSYGVSIGLFVMALRSLGAARTGALFATAPFVGSILAFLILRESLKAQFVFSMPMMILGASLLFSEAHRHEHDHAALDHEHRHRHDDLHHAHGHSNMQFAPMLVDDHSHWHQHDSLRHDHPHTPDIHHRHEHV